jgi:hypothetical protein
VSAQLVKKPAYNCKCMIDKTYNTTEGQYSIKIREGMRESRIP